MKYLNALSIKKAGMGFSLYDVINGDTWQQIFQVVLCDSY